MADEVETTSPLNGPAVYGSGPIGGPVVSGSSPLNGQPLVPLYKTFKHKLRNVEAPPDKKLVIEFFESLDASADEALKFWNHYQSTGWKTGNARIADWQAAANKWLIGNKQRNESGLVQQMDHLRTTKNKDYGKPL